MKLVSAPSARREQTEAFEFIATDYVAAATRQIDLLEAAAARLIDLPRLGAPMRRGRRKLQVRGTRFGLIYRVSRDMVVILHVWHGARQWPPARD